MTDPRVNPEGQVPCDLRDVQMIWCYEEKVKLHSAKSRHPSSVSLLSSQIPEADVSLVSRRVSKLHKRAQDQLELAD
eukprot:759869-Hanusia_phi.AAC.1